MIVKTTVWTALIILGIFGLAEIDSHFGDVAASVLSAILILWGSLWLLFKISAWFKKAGAKSQAVSEKGKVERAWKDARVVLTPDQEKQWKVLIDATIDAAVAAKQKQEAQKL